MSSGPAEGRPALCSQSELFDPENCRVVVFLLAGGTKLSCGMSLAETPPRCGLRALTESVSELLTRVGEEVLGLLEKRSGGSGGSGGRLLRLLLTERLAAAAERIVGLLEREVEEYRRQVERQSRLLEAVLSPVVRLNRAGELRPPCWSHISGLTVARQPEGLCLKTCHFKTHHNVVKRVESN